MDIEEFRNGDVLAQKIITPYLKGCGKEVKLFRGCRMVDAHRIEIGSYVQIDEGVRIFGGLGVSIGDYVHFALGVSISGGGKSRIGSFVSLGAGVRLITGSEIADGSGLVNPTVPTQFRSLMRGSVNIGDHALIFTNSVVMPNVTIGEGAVVSACSIVHHDLKPWGVYGGNPLVQIGCREKKRILDYANRCSEENQTKTEDVQRK